jgi:hypothetical protein
MEDTAEAKYTRDSALEKLPEVPREMKFLVNLCLSDSFLFQHFYVEMDVILI